MILTETGHIFLATLAVEAPAVEERRMGSGVLADELFRRLMMKDRIAIATVSSKSAISTLSSPI
jgi:hypothetical protein